MTISYLIYICLYITKYIFFITLNKNKKNQIFLIIVPLAINIYDENTFWNIMMLYFVYFLLDRAKIIYFNLISIKMKQ